MSSTHTALRTLVASLCDHDDVAWLFERVHVPASLQSNETQLNRAELAQALGMLLFLDLTQRVPEAKCYADEQALLQRQILLDHGALRTVHACLGPLPSGRAAFSRILTPLGYEEVGRYPLPKLNMCGFVYRHQDLPDSLPQYFVSELYPEAFSSTFQEAVQRVVGNSTDPLRPESRECLMQLQAEQGISLEQGTNLLANLLRCFARQHDTPTLEDYRLLKSESAEMAWIATEGNAFNHATDRVLNLDAVAQAQKERGRNMKPAIEEGRHANIRQTAYRATPVIRQFRSEGSVIDMEVPGSFFEFIERGTYVDPEGNSQGIDLRFDSANAQGIFKMTDGARNN